MRGGQLQSPFSLFRSILLIVINMTTLVFRNSVVLAGNLRLPSPTMVQPEVVSLATVRNLDSALHSRRLKYPMDFVLIKVFVTRGQADCGVTSRAKASSVARSDNARRVTPHLVNVDDCEIVRVVSIFVEGNIYNRQMGSPGTSSHHPSFQICIDYCSSTEIFNHDISTR